MSSTGAVTGGVRPYPTYLEALSIPGARRLLTWILAGWLGVAVALLGFFRWHIPALLGTFTLLSLCVAIVPLGMRGIYLIFLSWIPWVPTFLRQDEATNEEWYRWFQQEFDNFTSSRVPGFFGLLFAIIAIIAFWLGRTYSGLPPVMFLFAIAATAGAGFVCGVGLTAIYYLARFIWRTGRQYAVRVSGPGYGVLSTGRMLFRCYGLTAIIWCFPTASATWSPSYRIPLLALAAPAVMFFVGSFVICQFPLHRRMVECKREALIELEAALELLAPKQPVDMTEERRQKLEFCVAELARVGRWPEWPFSLGNLTGVFGASMGTILPQLIQALVALKRLHN